MQLFDTHCHIQGPDYALAAAEAIERAHAHGVDRMLCVGTTVEDSELAIAFAAQRQGVWAAIGLHPHDAKLGDGVLRQLANLLSPGPKNAKVVAIGECGLDYFYNHSDKTHQEKALRFQIELALMHDLPLVFHVRDAFEDFWPIFDSYSGLRGVLHSFTDSRQNLDKALAEGLFIGVNGIATFTKNPEQTAMFASIPLEHLLLETDAPFLTPKPYRGSINEPAHVRLVAEYMASLHKVSLADIATATSKNAQTLFID